MMPTLSAAAVSNPVSTGPSARSSSMARRTVSTVEER